MGSRRVEPPVGAMYRDDGIAKELVASTRGVGLACVMGFLCFLTLCLGATIAWASCNHILRGLSILPPATGKSASLGLALLLIAANLPCLAVAGFLAFCAAMATGGSVRVRLTQGTLELSRGVGSLRRTRQVQANQIVSLHESSRIAHTEGGSVTIKQIALVRREGKPMQFGGDLHDERRAWMRGALAEMLKVPDTTAHDDDDLDSHGNNDEGDDDARAGDKK